MAYKVQFPDGNQITIDNLAESIHYLCRKEYFKPALFEGKILDNIETWKVSIYKEKELIVIDYPLSPDSITVKVNFVDEKGNPMPGWGKYVISDSLLGIPKLRAETLFITFSGERIKDIEHTVLRLTDETYVISAVKYIPEKKELLAKIKKIILGAVRIMVTDSQYDGTLLNLHVRSTKGKQNLLIGKINLPYQIDKLRCDDYSLTIKSDRYKTIHTNFQIKSEELVEIPIRLSPSFTYKIVTTLKNNKKYVLCYFLCITLMLLGLYVQSLVHSQKLTSLVTDYNDSIARMECRSTNLSDSVDFLRKVLETNTDKSVDENIQSIRSRISRLTERLEGTYFTYSDIKELEEYRRFPLLFQNAGIPKYWEYVGEVIVSAKTILSIINKETPADSHNDQLIGIHKDIKRRLLSGDLARAYENSRRNDLKTIDEAIDYFTVHKVFNKLICPECHINFHYNSDMERHMIKHHGKNMER